MSSDFLNRKTTVTSLQRSLTIKPDLPLLLMHSLTVDDKTRGRTSFDVFKSNSLSFSEQENRECYVSTTDRKEKLELLNKKDYDRHVVLRVGLLDLRSADVGYHFASNGFRELLDSNGLYQGPHINFKFKVALTIGALRIAFEPDDISAQDIDTNWLISEVFDSFFFLSPNGPIPLI